MSSKVKQGFEEDFFVLISICKKRASDKGAHGVEPWTSRSAVECSTTELYPLQMNLVLGIQLFILIGSEEDFFVSYQFVKKERLIRGHTELNHGPLDLQSNALPLSYTPF